MSAGTHTHMCAVLFLTVCGGHPTATTATGIPGSEIAQKQNLSLVHFDMGSDVYRFLSLTDVLFCILPRSKG